MANEKQVEAFMELAEEYARHLVAVDFWSGRVKSASLIEAAEDVKAKLRRSISSLAGDGDLLEQQLAPDIKVQDFVNAFHDVFEGASFSDVEELCGRTEAEIDYILDVRDKTEHLHA
ncbi:hypothetical protein [Rhizobium sp. BK176]|uniref:hypothetical protein n=1 Tax=Rhizobium sp. BK176 TaxID=2587071 RepID=UPI002169EBEE|nr:hypothetical protein [Rhizobium sp. BK176]MCS4089546.1 hypothetical protein [Rhizobium sp. BK176]